MRTAIDSRAPVSITGAPAVACAVEAGVLALCGLAFLATQLAYPGGINLAYIPEVVPVIIAIGAIALSAWLAWRGMSGVGLMVAIVALWIATFWFGQAREAGAKHVDTLEFSTLGDSVRGAELFVNGVDLGPSPVRISKQEFERRVPSWDKPPAGFDEKVFVPIRRPQWESCYDIDYTRWYAWDQPKVSTGKLYYQARYAGEFGAASGFASGGDQTRIGFIFPQRDVRLRLLLNQARLADYHVTADWFRALETFDEDGLVTLRKLALQEPGMEDVLSQWARWKYSLDAVHNAGDAWDALMRVCRESDRNGVYLTPSVAGRAVQILARQVDPDRLVQACSKVIADTGGATFVMWPIGEQMQFGTADSSEKLNYIGGNSDGNNSDEQGQFYGTGGMSGSVLTPGGLVIAHALAEMWKAGIGHERIQSEIGPDLLAWHYDSGLTLPLVLAAKIGGPEVDAFLLAQPWQHQMGPGEHEMGVFEAGGYEINRWLYVLTCLNDSAGQTFRREHAAEILDMADKLVQINMIIWNNQSNFLLDDHELAWKFWPRFHESARKNQFADEVIRMEYTYLQMMNAPASAFIDLWKEDRPGWEAADQAFGVLRFNTPAERGAPIAAGLLDYFQHDPHAMDQIPSVGNRHALITELMKIVNPDEQFLADIRKYTSDATANGESFALHMNKSASIWLSGPGGLSPVVAQPADAPEPALRLLSLSAIRGVPVASNRQLLRKLLSDPDPTVQREARSLDTELKSLAAQPPNELVSDGPASTQP